LIKKKAYILIKILPHNPCTLGRVDQVTNQNDSHESYNNTQFQIWNTEKKSNISLWTERWFLSSNAKDIGTLYLMFALFSGLIGTAFSVLIRLELSGPGVQYIADNQLYNSIITAHAIVMIFFMVKYNANKLNENLKLSSVNATIGDNNFDVKIGKYNNSNKSNKDLNPKHKYVKVLVEDPYNNRDIILKLTKRWIKRCLYLGNFRW